MTRGGAAEHGEGSTAKMDTVRAFVGTTVDLAATRRLVELSVALRRAAPGLGLQARWVPPPQLHLTLKFLGELDAGLGPALGDALASVATAQGAFRVRLRGLGVFPGSSEAETEKDLRPRVLYVRVTDGDAALCALAEGVEAACAQLGLPRSTRALVPHVALARFERLPEGAAAGAAIEALLRTATRLHDAGPGRVTELALYRSDGLRSGVEYPALARHRLRAEALERAAGGR